MKKNILGKHTKTAISTGLLLLFSYPGTHVDAASTDIADYPMAVSNMVTPNVLVVYDNSQSMDAYMQGTLVSGSDPLTRGNIGRKVMRESMLTYQGSFNWGLMTYKMSDLEKRNTYAYYLGSDSGMVFTSDCTGYVAGTPPTPGKSASNGGRSCIANPQPFTGGEYVTYDASGDDANILDVLYTDSSYEQLWGLTTSGTSYHIYTGHSPSSGNSWASSAFTGSQGTWSFTPTDAGYLSESPPITRQLYVPRGWGYIADITGAGELNVQVAASTDAQIASLTAKLQNETDSTSTTEIKNGAVFTPLKGTLESAKTYFSSSFDSKSTPIQYACQQNFVMLVTDGLPTGTTGGELYSVTDRTNTCDWSTITNSCTSGAFGNAANEAIAAVSALRATTSSGATSTYPDGTGSVTGKFDIRTYVVALGNTVANANAMSVMNAMAHAGGTNRAIGAADEAGFRAAFAAISDDINAKVGAAAAVAISNVRLTSADNDSFITSYNSGTWTGDLEAFDVDSVTGLQLTTPLWTSGSAATQLDLRTPSSRYIVTSTDTTGDIGIGGVQFQPTSATTSTKLSTAQQTLLNSPVATDGPAVLAYLRGDRSGEGTTYRARAHLLGDLINAEPVLVKAPSARYADEGYSTFKTAHATRPRVLFQGSNDGMLHAFVASTGAESWAFIPNLVMGDLNNLSRKPGFTHKYYVDGTPVSGDVDFNKVAGVTATGNDWRTILVGGLAKGGRGYYALDVTNPVATSEADAQAKVLWEFPNSITNSTARNAAKVNLGYTYGKPIIVKTQAAGWVVLVTSGYNNGTNTGDSGGDGLGHLYVINPKTGDLIKDIPTPSCSTTPTSNPCGLAHISAYVDSELDSTTDYVYGGDLYGNVWRFNLTGAATSDWSVAKFATLKDSAGAVQPITTAPELSLIDQMRMVFIGTGRYLGNTDVTTSQTQTIYGLRDSLTALDAALRDSLQQQTLSTSGTKRTLSNNEVNYGTNKSSEVGWYIDLPSTGERVIGDPIIALSTLIVTTNIPSSTKCSPGGSSWEYFINLKTGGLAEKSTVTWSGTFLGNALSSRATIVQLPNGKVISLTRSSDARTLKEDVPISSTSSTKKRISWREIMR